MSGHTGAAAALALLRSSKLAPDGRDVVGCNLARAARNALRRVLAAHGGAMAPAASSLGVTHLTLEALCVELGVETTNGRRT